MAKCRPGSACPGGAELSQPRLCATRQVSRSCCLTRLFPFLVGQRTEHGLSVGHRVTPRQHSLAQIPHSQSAQAASPGLPVPALQSVGTTRATPFLPSSASRDDHPLPVPPCHLWQHPQGRGSHPGTKYLLSADVGLRQLGHVSAGLGCARAHACQHWAPLRSHPAGCAWPGRGRSAQAGRGGHTASGAERSRAERGPARGQGGPRRSRGERGKGPRGRHASQR